MRKRKPSLILDLWLCSNLNLESCNSMANIVLEIIIRVVDVIYIFFVHLAAKTERNFNGYVLKWCGI